MQIKTAEFLKLSANQFKGKIEKAKAMLLNCCLCPRNCGVNRLNGEIGFCKAGYEIEVSSHQLHFGEEPPLSGRGGAGAIFFTHCNLACVYCQNYQISRQQNIKETISPAQLSFIMLKLQQQGAQNIDLVSPGHFMPQIVEAIYLARIKGLELPIVYNTNAYENINVIKFLSGIVDIYLPDVKYSNAYMAEKYSQVPDYPEIAFKAIVEMYKQCGGLIINEAGCAQSGVLVRHLVLPGKIAGSFEILEFLKYNISLDVGLSLMSQYAPCYQAGRFAELNRTITVAEYNEVVNFAEFLGFENCWVQAIESNAVYFPDFAGKEVF